MAGLLDKIIGTHSEREIRRIIGRVDAIEALRPEMQKLTDDELRAFENKYANPHVVFSKPGMRIEL